MDQFYPEQTITLTSRDPPYVTPAIKSMLRRQNKLMRAVAYRGGGGQGSMAPLWLTECYF
jgi:hypothetical protein